MSTDIVTAEILSRNPSKVAQAIFTEYTQGKQDTSIYTDPHTVWHSYERFDKIKKLNKSIAVAAEGAPRPRFAEARHLRIQVIDGDGGITVLLTTRITTHAGRVFYSEGAMIYLLNAEGKVHRIEAYTDPREQEREAWRAAHVQMFDGVVMEDGSISKDGSLPAK